MPKIANIVLNSFINDSRVLKTSKTLQMAGADVCVLALHERDLPKKQAVDGITVIRLPLATRTWPKVLFIQVFKYLEFLIRAVAQAKSFDAVHCNDLGALPIGVAIRLINRKASLVYDAHEYETEMNGLSSAERFIRRITEKLFIRFADHVFTVSPMIAAEYSRLYKIPTPSLVLNCPNYKTSSRKNLFRDKFGIPSTTKIFLYQGAITTGRGIEEIVRLFSESPPKNSALVLMGNGPLVGAIQSTLSTGAPIYYLPAVPPHVLLDYTSSADVGVCLIEDTCLSYRYCLPNKLFEYLMAGLPVLVSDLPELRRVVNDWQVGMVLDTQSLGGLKDAFDSVARIDQAEIAARIEVAKGIFNWEQQEVVIKAAYSNVL